MRRPDWSCAAARGRPLFRQRYLRAVLGFALLAGMSGRRASACDLCAVYTGTEAQQGRAGWRLGVAEQVSYFATLRDGGDAVPNDDERMTSAITQVVLGYNLSDTLGAQFSLPIISRTFTRVSADGLDHGDETGLGDASILALYSPLRWVSADSVVRGTVFGGIKLPTGSTNRLREELDEAETPEFPDVPGRGLPGFGPAASRSGAGGITASPPVVGHHTTPHETESGLHGHDLALGSGSVDGIVGARIFASWKRIYGTGSLQYFVRNQGSFNYQYANEILWRIGPGAFLALDDTGLGRGYTLGLEAILSGESKGQDKLSGVKLDDTAITSLYLGPTMNFTWGESLQATLGGELPVLQNNSALQLVPDFRVQGALTWRF